MSRTLALLLGGLVLAGGTVLHYRTGRLQAAPILAARDPQALADALNLANSSVNDTGSYHLPEFATWPMRDAFSQCGSGSTPAPQPFFKVTAQFGRKHTFFKKASFPDQGSAFHYDPATYKRLCGAVTQTTGAPLLRGGVGRISAWWNGFLLPARPASIAGKFDEGARSAAVGWAVIPKPSNAGLGTLMYFNKRIEDGGQSRQVRILVSQQLLDASPACGETVTPSTPPVGPRSGVDDVQIDAFFRVQLQSGDKFDSGGCGDFLILTNFNLTRRHDVLGHQTPWLWAAFWWDPVSTNFRPGGPLTGPGPNPQAWANYAMDASYNSDLVMYNPGFENQNSNCAFCHWAAARIPNSQQPAGPGAANPSLLGMSLDFVVAPTDQQ